MSDEKDFHETIRKIVENLPEGYRVVSSYNGSSSHSGSYIVIEVLPPGVPSQQERLIEGARGG